MIENLISSSNAILLIIINIIFSFFISRKIIFVKNLKLNFLILHNFFYFFLAQILFALLLFGLNINEVKILFYISYIIIFILLLLNLKKVQMYVNEISENKRLNFISFFIFFILLLLVISPITDADSLDYHLGGPMDILKKGFLYSREDHWFHFRLIGSGEMINLYGLIFNSKNFGQIFQLIPLMHIFILFQFVFKKKPELPLLLLFSSPILIHLILSAKHLLFLTNIYLLIFYILKFKSNELLRSKKLVYVIIFLNFIPIAFKYSYLIYSLPIFIFIIISQIKIINIKNLFLTLFLSGIFISFFYVKNLLFYLDPLSPFLEFLKTNPEKLVLNFANELRYSKKIFHFNEFFFIPFLQINPLTTSPTLVLTPIVLIFYYYILKSKDLSYKFLIIIIFILLFFSGKSQSRFYFDLYLIVIILSSSLIEKIYLVKINKFILRILLSGYALITFVIVFFGIFSLTLPSYLGQKSFNNMMSKNANDYEISNFLNKNIEEQEIIFHDYSIRSKSFQKYLFYYFNFENLNLKQIQNLIQNKQPSKIVINEAIFNKLKRINSCPENEIKSKFTNRSTRNPYNRIKNIDKIFIVDTKCLIYE